MLIVYLFQTNFRGIVGYRHRKRAVKKDIQCLQKQNGLFMKGLFKVYMTQKKNLLRILKAVQKMQKNGIFHFGISFFVLEISTFLYYANQESDEVMRFATKNGKLLNKEYLWKY